jgi:hypothetical protein
MTNTKYTYFVSGIVFLPAGLSERTVPKALVAVYFEAEQLQSANDALHKFYRDDNIVSVDAHLTDEVFNVSSGEWPSQL